MDGDHEINDDDATSSTPDRESSGERAGVYLAALAALAVPSLIVLALFMPALSPSSNSSTPARPSPTEPAPTGSGLDRVEIEPSGESSSDPAVDVAGAGLARDDVTTEIADAVGIVADDPQIAGPSRPADTTSPTTRPPAEPGSPATTEAPPTTSPPSTPSAPPTTAVPPSTAAPATTRPPTEPAAFAQRVDIGRIGEQTVQFRFASTDDTAYETTIRSGADVVARTAGVARAGIVVNELVRDLEPGTPYTVEVALGGEPTARSPRIDFRTSGDGPIAEDDTPVELLDVQVVQVDPTRFEVNYASNVCTNGSFVIRRQDGSVVGRNDGQAAGCTTRHLAIPGFWTAPLEPNTTYVITLQVEANGAGRGAGNVAARSLTVTTAT